MTLDEFWNIHNTLLTGHFYPEIRENSDFTHYKSIFKQKAYNFIKPSVESNELNWPAVENLIKKEASEGYEISFYIPKHLLENYRETLRVKEYILVTSDVFVAKTISRPYEIDTEDFVEASSANFEEFQRVVQETFPDYDNNTEYTEFCFSQFQKYRDKFLNYMQVKGSRFTSFGSILISDSLEIGFMHNIGTMEKFRRQGQFTLLTKFLANTALQNGAKTTYANVEENCASYHGFKKLGYEEVCSSYVFSKE